MKKILLSLGLGLALTSTMSHAQNSHLNYLNNWMQQDPLSSSSPVSGDPSTQNKPAATAPKNPPKNWQSHQYVPSAMERSLSSNDTKTPAVLDDNTRCTSDEPTTTEPSSNSYWERVKPGKVSQGCIKSDKCFQSPGSISADCGLTPTAGTYPTVQPK